MKPIQVNNSLRCCSWQVVLDVNRVNGEVVRVIALDEIEARIYQVEQGYRVEVSSCLSDYWHPGVFWDLNLLEEWLEPELEKLNAGFALGGDWMMLEGDFDGNGRYRDWFICQAQQWHAYDPTTNCCYSAPSLIALMAKIDRIEAVRRARTGEHIS